MFSPSRPSGSAYWQLVVLPVCDKYQLQ